MMSVQEKYMQRCLQIAALARGKTLSNPMVGSVLVHQDAIIGEGYHELYGGPHAEVNCINNAEKLYHKRKDHHLSFDELLRESTIYVSLEPCAHYGKTPPCADLIINRRISQVVVGCRDPFPLVDGKGIEKLRAAGVKVQVAVLEKQCQDLNKRFFTFHLQKRPYIILKWAQSQDGFIAGNDNTRTFISNAITNRLVHKWRSEEASIMVGTKTALADDPVLTNRLWSGTNPVRLVIDLNLRLPTSLKIFEPGPRTIVLNHLKERTENGIEFLQLKTGAALPFGITQLLFEQGIQSLLIEGGPQTLQSFIDQDLWDEARIITNSKLHLYRGLRAPQLKHGAVEEEFQLRDDLIQILHRPNLHS